MSPKIRLARMAFAIGALLAIAIGGAASANASEHLSDKQCANKGTAVISYNASARTFTGVFSLPKGCEGVIYVNPLDMSTKPQGTLIADADRVFANYPASTSVTTAAIPVAKFGADCSIQVQADARFSGKTHKTSEFVKAWKGTIKLPAELCNKSTPTPSPSNSTPPASTPPSGNHTPTAGHTPATQPGHVKATAYPVAAATGASSPVNPTLVLIGAGLLALVGCAAGGRKFIVRRGNH